MNTMISGFRYSIWRGRSDIRQIPQIQTRCFLNGNKGTQKNSNHVLELAPTTLARGAGSAIDLGVQDVEDGRRGN